MDRQQHQQQQQPEPVPPAEKQAPSLTRRQRAGISTRRSTTPTPQRLSFAKPSSAPPAAGAPPPAPAPSLHNSSGAVAAATNAAKFSFGKPLGGPPNAPLPRLPTDKNKPASRSSSHNGDSSSGRSSSNNNNSNISSNDNNNNTKDWLVDTEAELKQDLETTKKELELIRTIMWEMEMEETSSSPPSSQTFIKTSPESTAAMAMAATQQRSQHKMLMAACREYAESRRQLLRERLRQIQFWTGSRDMGRRVPSAAPGDWAVADAEWARWLSDQAAAMQQLQQQQQQQRSLSPTIVGDAVATWGPLPHILATFTFSAEQVG